MARSARASSVVDRSLLAFCLLASTIVVFLPGPLRDRAAAALRRTVAAPLAELQRRAELGRAAFVTYEDRMLQRGEIAERANEARALAAENARLRALLGLGARLEWGFVTAEAIPNEVVGRIVDTQLIESFSVTAGSRAGIQSFTPVVAVEGLVGMVKQVSPSTSLAISYLDPDFRVSAMTADAGAFGIAQPHLGGGAQRGLLEIRGVPFRSPLKPGQLVVSSGLGATYPAGIPVGTVIREIQTPEKWARTYLLQPSASLATIGPVLLLLKKRSDAGVQTVWTSIPSVDSASRAIASAGDSIAQTAATREMAARRAALDSVMRDSLGTDSLPRPAAAPAAPTPARPDSTRRPAGAPPAGDSAARPRPRPDTGVRPRPRPDSAAAAAGVAPRARPRGDSVIAGGPRADSGAARPRPRPDSAPRPARPAVPIPGGRQ